MTHSVPRALHSSQGDGPPVHFVFRFLHASQAAEILALAGRLRADGALEGWPSFAGMIERLCCDAVMVALISSSNQPSVRAGAAHTGLAKACRPEISG